MITYISITQKAPETNLQLRKPVGSIVINFEFYKYADISMIAYKYAYISRIASKYAFISMIASKRHTQNAFEGQLKRAVEREHHFTYLKIKCLYKHVCLYTLIPMHKAPTDETSKPTFD